MSTGRRYTADERRRIIEEFMSENGGVYDPATFVEAAASEQHPAHEWFTWDNDLAGHQYRLAQARQFAKVRVLVEEEHETDMTDGSVTIRVPLLVSPEAGHDDGGGYIRTVTEDGTAEMRRQALSSGFGLKAWLRRYRAFLRDDEVTRAEGLVKLIEKNG